MSNTNPSLSPAEDEETTADAVQLIMVATFNGLCEVLKALGRRHLLSPEELAAIHEAMTWPLDDPDNRDDPVIVTAREEVETVLADALARERHSARRPRRPRPS